MSLALARAETAKLRSLASTWWFLGATVAVSLVFSALGRLMADEGARPGIAEAMTGPAFGQILITVLAARAATQEFATGTIWASYLAVPSWRRLLCAKAAVLAALACVAGAVLALGGLAVAALTQGAGADLVPDTALELRQLAAVPAAYAVCALFGVAAGVLLRSGGLTVTVLLVWILAAESLAGALISWLLKAEAAAWLPFTALADFLGQPGTVHFPAGPYAAGLYAAALAGAALAAAVAVQGRRER